MFIPPWNSWLAALTIEPGRTGTRTGRKPGRIRFGPILNELSKQGWY